MSLLAALVLALLGALGTGWIVWLRRETHFRQRKRLCAIVT